LQRKFGKKKKGERGMKPAGRTLVGIRKLFINFQERPLGKDLLLRAYRTKSTGKKEKEREVRRREMGVETGVPRSGKGERGQSREYEWGEDELGRKGNPGKGSWGKGERR